MSAELIRDYYRKFNERQFDRMLELLADDVVHDLNEGPSEMGRERFRSFMGVMNEHYSEQVKDLVIFSSDEPRRFAAEFFIEGTYLKTQAGLPPAREQTYRLRVGAFFEVHGGRITRVTNYYNLKRWMELVNR